MSPNEISGYLLTKGYNATKVGLEVDAHRTNVWDVINRRTKLERIRVRIVKILREEDDTLISRFLNSQDKTINDSYYRIWGDKNDKWYLEHV